MKKSFFFSILVFSSLTILLTQTQTGCTKEAVNVTDTVKVTQKDTVFTCPLNIRGLWEGTYTVGTGNPVPAGTSFYFSFSIYPNGKISYKSKGYYNGSSEYITFADGTWTLNGTIFSFNVTTINYASSSTQITQTGTATYNASNGTLTNGTFNGSSGSTWAMTKVN